MHVLRLPLLQTQYLKKIIKLFNALVLENVQKKCKDKLKYMTVYST